VARFEDDQIAKALQVDVLGRTEDGLAGRTTRSPVHGQGCSVPAA
jgi:hypothetical protein